MVALLSNGQEMIPEELLYAKLAEIRKALEPAWSGATGFVEPWPLAPRSAGQCAVSAAIVKSMLGGTFLSAPKGPISHWFNRVDGYDVDITGDQFGVPAIQITDTPYGLYECTRERLEGLNEETLKRAILLARQAGLRAVEEDLRTWTPAPPRYIKPPPF